MGISIRAYARHRGVSDTAVYKAIKTARITTEPDGTIEPDKADQQWQQNTDPTKQRNQAKKSYSTTQQQSVLKSDDDSYLKLKMVNESLKAKLANLKLTKEKGEMVDKSFAFQQAFIFARTIRNHWLNWPAQITTELAATLQVDPNKLQTELESLVREQLIKISKATYELESDVL